MLFQNLILRTTIVLLALLWSRPVFSQQAASQPQIPRVPLLQNQPQQPVGVSAAQLSPGPVRKGRHHGLLIDDTKNSPYHSQDIYSINAVIRQSNTVGDSLKKTFTISKPILGLKLQELPAALKSQLKIPKDQGLMVTGFLDDPGSSAWILGLTYSIPIVTSERQILGRVQSEKTPSPKRTDPQALPAERVKTTAVQAKETLSKLFKKNDILLTANKKPLTNGEELLKVLLVAGRKKEVTFKILREAEGAFEANIRAEDIVLPSRRDQLFGPLAQTEEKYLIGISPSKLDELTRTVLKLPTDQGLVIKKVLAGSAAEKAGVKQYDIILKIDGRPVADSKTLIESVQESEGKDITLNLLREGAEQTVTITPESSKQYEVVNISVSRKWTSEWPMPFSFHVGTTPAVDGPGPGVTPLAAPIVWNIQEGKASTTATVKKQINEIRKSIESLNRTLNQLEKQLSKTENSPSEERKTTPIEPKPAEK